MGTQSASPSKTYLPVAVPPALPPDVDTGAVEAEASADGIAEVRLPATPATEEDVDNTNTLFSDPDYF